MQWGGGTIELLADVTENVTVQVSQEIVIDLNGHTWSGGDDNENAHKDRPALLNYGTVTIRDSSAEGTGTVKRDDVLKDGVVAGNGYYVIDNQGTLTIESGNFYNGTGVNGKGASLIRNAGISAAATLNIEGGTFTQDNFIVIKNDDYGILNISGGEINSETESAIQNWSQATISGGTVNGLIWTMTWSDEFEDSNTTIKDNAQINGVIRVEQSEKDITKEAHVVIEGGTLSVEWYDGEGGDITVSGGTFSSEVPEEYLAEGLEQKTDENGKIIVFDPNAPVVEPSKPAEKSDNTALIGALAVGAVAVTALSWKYLPVHKATGSVQDKEWNGLPGATVTLLRDGEVIRTATTNAGGGYELYVPKGNYTLVASYTVPETGEQVSASIEIAAPTSGYSGDIVLNW